MDIFLALVSFSQFPQIYKCYVMYVEYKYKETLKIEKTEQIYFQLYNIMTKF